MNDADLPHDDLTLDLDLGFDGAEEILRAWRRGMRLDADLTVSEWADAHRWLSSRASAEPGRYRTARTPYLRAIMDALSPSHPAQRISFMKAAQVGATEAGNNWIGFVIHHAPGPMLAVLPTVEMAKRTSRGRIDPLIEDNRARLLTADWLPTKWDWVDPLKDANAEIAQIEAGLKSRTQAIAERGYDAEQVDREIAAERARERALGLDFRRPGSPAQGVQAVPQSDDDDTETHTDTTDDAEDGPRPDEDQT